MTDRRFNDISCKLRRMADQLDAQARAHRHLADQLDHIVQSPAPVAETAPPHLVALDVAAMQLVDLPAAEIRTAAPVVARASGQQVYPVAIRAQQLRRARKERRRRDQTIALLQCLAKGATLKDASDAIGVSEATGRRLRDAWRDQ